MRTAGYTPGECIEGAVLIMGYDRFLIWLRRRLDIVHNWLQLATDYLVRYVEAMIEAVEESKG